MRSDEEQQRKVLFDVAKAAAAVSACRQSSPTQEDAQEMLKPHTVFRGKSRVPLRKGKWTPEEEAYANRIIYYFNQGTLGIPAGTTLRSYLSERLNCDPMRITKKFAGASCIGKQVFAPCEQTVPNIGEMRRCEDDLGRLENVFIERLEHKGTVTFDLGDRDTTKESKNVQEWLRNTIEGGRHASSRVKGSGSISAGPSMKRAASAPDLGELSQIREDKRRRMTCIDDDLYNVDDQAAGDLLLDFFKKLHADHARTENLSCVEAKSDGILVGSKRSIVACQQQEADDTTCKWIKSSASPESKCRTLTQPVSAFDLLSDEATSEEHKSSDSSLSPFPRTFPNTSPQRSSRVPAQGDELDLPVDIPAPLRLSLPLTSDEATSLDFPSSDSHSPARTATRLLSPGFKRIRSETALRDMNAPLSNTALSPRSHDVARWILKLKPPYSPARGHSLSHRNLEETLVRESTTVGAQTPTPV